MSAGKVPWVHEYDGAGHRDGQVHAMTFRQKERALLAIGCVRRASRLAT